MNKICIVCEANPAKNPRPNRLVNLLKNKYEVCVIGLEASDIEGVKVFSYPYAKKRNAQEEQELEQNVANKDFMKLVKIPNRMLIEKYLQGIDVDIIFCHDILLLPIVLENKKNAKVIFDAREYYPKQCEDDERWMRLFAPFMEWLCKTYLKQCDYVYTVCEGIAQEYIKNYNIKCGVITSAAKYHLAQKDFLKVDDKKIKMIHHGVSNINREIHKMIEMMDFVDERFTLDLMLVDNGNKEYFDRLYKMTESRKNVKIISPVSFNEIIPFTSKYDIGIHLLQSKNFNVYHMLPNKFFEFIQARLMIAIGPSPEMERYVKKYNLGIVAKDFTPQSMAKELNKLTKEKIIEYKKKADNTAKEVNAESEGKIILNIVKEFL